MVSISPIHGGLVFEGQKEEEKKAGASLFDRDPNKDYNPVPCTIPFEERLALVRAVGEEVLMDDALVELLKKKQQFITYDGFEPSGRMHIAQGILKKINVNRITRAGGIFVFWVADWFAMLNHKMGGDLKKIQTLGKYFVEIWRACGMDLKNVKFLWASEEILNNAETYWPRVMDIATKNTLARIVKCSQIMGRKEQDTLSASQIFYPCMQCSDIFHLKADICQLGKDQRKVNVLALEYCDAKGVSPKPVMVHHHMLLGLKQDPNSEEPTKMSKSDPDAAIFMEDSYDQICAKIKRAYCPPGIVKLNPVLEYCKYLIFPSFDELVIDREEKHGGNLVFKKYDDLEKDYVEQKLHPADLKAGVIKYVNMLIEPVRKHFETDEYAKNLLARVIQLRAEQEKEKSGKK